jgi:hypothetical protein
MALAPSLGRVIITVSGRGRGDSIYLLREVPPTRHHIKSESVGDHWHQSVFGEDVKAFRPECWLQGDRFNMDKYFFAYGSRAEVCLGAAEEYQLDGNEQVDADAISKVWP